jgi:hypothetical protein
LGDEAFFQHRREIVAAGAGKGFITDFGGGLVTGHGTSKFH